MTDEPSLRVQPPDVTTRSLARNTLLSYASSVFSMLNGMAGSIIMARSLGPKQLGIYSGAAFVISLSIVICSFGISATIIKILSEYSARFDRATITRVVRLFAFGVLVPAGLSALVIAVALPLSSRDGRYGPIVAISALSAIPMLLAQSYRAIASGFQEFGYLLRLNLAGSVLLLFCNVLVALLRPSVGAFIIAGLAPNVLLVAALVLHYRGYLFGGRQLAPLPREQLKGIVSFMWPVALITVLDTIVWQCSEVLFLGKFRPPQEVAHYSIAFGLSAMLLRGIASSVTAGFVPALSQLHGSGDEERIRTAFFAGLRLSLVFVTPLAAMISVVAKPVVRLFYGEAFLGAATYVPALVTAAALGSIAGLAADVLYATRQQRALLMLAVTVAVLNLGLDAWLIPDHGVLGAVTANTAAQAAAALGTLSLCFARYRQGLPLRAYFGPLAAGSLVVVATWLSARDLHGPVAIVTIGVVGTSVYVLAARVLRLLAASDVRLLASVVSHVPNRVARVTLDGLLRFCAPHVEMR